jgi:hypothetical protein
LFLRRWGRVCAVFPVGAVAIALGSEAFVNTWTRFNSPAPGFQYHPHPYSPGAGFYLIVIGGALLTVIWMVLIVEDHYGEHYDAHP